ncbi:uncharacterized protein LOC102803480 [Saccoglossus kowalevskii]|uniref:Origin recognition complex subunit 4-like n=1 Tax=Saccoglossus kowalevskii TaxID=10224 RepID=A0ABM0LZG2_SACKO|nr:PREDICTED: origin recognition complex subunit 4-like [Saccoglossus kowalevskii]
MSGSTSRTKQQHSADKAEEPASAETVESGDTEMAETVDTTEREVPPKRRGRKPGSTKKKAAPTPQQPLAEGEKRGRGRPRKLPRKETSGPKRPRGRPRKYPPKVDSGPKRPRGRPRKSEGDPSVSLTLKIKKGEIATSKKKDGRGRKRKEPSAGAATPSTKPAGVKRGRGRPPGSVKKRKVVEEIIEEAEAESSVAVTTAATEPPAVKKPRSKPPKKAMIDAVAAEREASGE